MSAAGLKPLYKTDFLIALGVALLGLAVYSRVLAPDVLYSDSGEFQTLAYTWGTTHTTGYPVYLVLARLVGFVPIGSLAWRISFASAIFAAVTLGGVYLIVRHFTHQGGAVFGSIVLLLSYTFWSQSIIAEVYTSATAFMVVIVLVLLRWHEQPIKRRWLVGVVGFLLGIGPGVHLFILLIAPSVLLFVLCGMVFGGEAEQKKTAHILRFIGGGIAGLAAFYALFVFIDMRPTPTNIFTTAILPSRETWGLQESDLDTEPERFWISVSGYQWRNRMIPGDVDYAKTLRAFLNETLPKEYATPSVLLAMLGICFVFIRSRRWAVFFVTAFLITFGAGFLYFPGDKFIFYLPFYVLVAILTGMGVGAVIELTLKLFRLPPASWLNRGVAVVIAGVLLVVCAAPFATSRWRSLERGFSGFITDDYVYPVLHPHETRLAAECALSKVAEPGAFLVLDWRALYSIYYVAYLEHGRTNLIIREALPYPAQVLTPLLQAEIAERVRNGVAVYVDKAYTPLSSTYKMTEIAGKCMNYRLMKLSMRS